jgi:uncharacterized protein involved in exopolysaccharide biosynthesis
MNAPLRSPRQTLQILEPLKSHLLLWSVPAILITLLATAYAMLRTDTWQASQGMLVRDETVGNLGRQGRFDSSEARKTAQETLLEIARNETVVAAALARLPRPAGRDRGIPWPSDDDVQRAQDSIKVSAPKGTELGRTDVVYLSACRTGRQEAIRLVDALCEQLQTRLQELRNAKAVSVLAELERTYSLAKTDLDAATKKLETLERKVGSDLGELRILNESGAGESNLRSGSNKIKEELRQSRANLEGMKELQKLLLAAMHDPSQLLAMPSQLLESQPALRRLKDGLVDSQLRTAQILGKMSEEHPLAKAALESERKVRENLRNELGTALQGLDAEIHVSQTQVASLSSQLAEVQGRLDRLAELRARYGNLVADVRQKSQGVDETARALAEARASQSAAKSASLLTPLDAPSAGNSPTGPSRAAIIGSGGLGGLMVGFGLVLLIGPLKNMRGRRWSDFLPGRRWSDATRAQPQAAATQGGRRTSDPPPAATVAAWSDATPVAVVPAEPVAAGGDRRGGSGRRTSDRK